MTVRIVEGQLPYSGGTGIGIDANKVISLLLREENNLIQVNGDNEIYTDLQLVANIKPTDEFPVGVTVGKILQSNGWTQSGLLLNRKTTSGDYARWIYANDGKIYFDNGTGVWKQVYYSSEVDTMVQTLRNYVDTFQPKLTAGTGINIDQNNVISTTGTGTGDVVGPSSATDGNLAVFDGTTGKLIKDGGPIPTPTPVVDALDSTSTTSALSANQGRVLNGKIADLMGLGKFLSLWDSTTGQPLSFPYATPYAYTTGDYFLVENISSATPPVNYKPDGSSYTGTASSVTESEEVEVGDVYIYDGSIWLLQTNHGKVVSFSEIAGQPADNTNLSGVLFNATNGGVKVFTFPSANDDITSLVTWLNSGGDAILKDSNSYCRVTMNDSVNKEIRAIEEAGSSRDEWVIEYDSSKIVTSILATERKYFAPDNAGSIGDVLTKKVGGYEWGAPTGGDTIEYVTQAEYTALLPGALTDNKHYFIYDPGLPPSPPIDGMVAYYLLEANANDTKADFGATGTTYNASWVGTSSYTTLGGKTTATFNNSDYINTGISVGSGPITIACLFYSTETQLNYRTIMGTPMTWSGGGKHIGMCFHDITKFFARCGSSHQTESSPLTISSNAWYFAAIRIDNSGNAIVNLDTTTRTETSSSYNITDTIYIGAGLGNKFNGGVKCVGIWNKSLSDAELQQYKDYLDSL